jgi:ribonuclease P protein component
VLPPAHRMRRSADFSTAVRRGRRVRRGTVVVHQLTTPAAAPFDGALEDAVGHPAGVRPADPATVGFVVGRSVGNSVARHRVSRRLRAVVAGRLDELPPGSSTVIRALPEAADAGSGRLAADVDGALARLAGHR